MKLSDLKVGNLYKWQSNFGNTPFQHWLILEELPTDPGSHYSRNGLPHRRFRWYCLHGPDINSNIIFDVSNRHLLDFTLVS